MQERQLKYLFLQVHKALVMYLPTYCLAAVHISAVNELFLFEKITFLLSETRWMWSNSKTRLANQRAVAIKVWFHITHNTLEQGMVGHFDVVC